MWTSVSVSVSASVSVTRGRESDKCGSSALQVISPRGGEYGLGVHLVPRLSNTFIFLS